MSHKKQCETEKADESLACEKAALPEHNLLPLKAKVEDKSDVARGGHHEGEILLADVGEQAHKETLTHTHIEFS